MVALITVRFLYSGQAGDVVDGRSIVVASCRESASQNGEQEKTAEVTSFWGVGTAICNVWNLRVRSYSDCACKCFYWGTSLVSFVSSVYNFHVYSFALKFEYTFTVSEKRAFIQYLMHCMFHHRHSQYFVWNFGMSIKTKISQYGVPVPGAGVTYT